MCKKGQATNKMSLTNVESPQSRALVRALFGSCPTSEKSAAASTSHDSLHPSSKVRSFTGAVFLGSVFWQNGSGTDSTRKP